MTTLVEPGKLIGLSDVMQRAEARLDDLDEYIAHQREGTIDDYYTQTLLMAVMDLAILPVSREIEGLTPEDVDESEDIKDVLRNIITMTAFRFHRSIGEVEQDFLTLFKQFPTADVRQSTMLRYQGLLH